MMTNNISFAEEVKQPLSVNKWKFILWLFIVTIVMLFASQTSAYIVRRAEGNWTEFALPQIFWYSTAVLLFSSIAMQWAKLSAKKNSFSNMKIAISITFVLGLVFLAMQFLGWQELQIQGVFLKGNPSGSFLYIFTGLHAFHLISGLVVLLYAFVAVFKMKVHSKNLTQIEIATTYWHFLDLLWIYLFIVLINFR